MSDNLEPVLIRFRTAAQEFIGTVDSASGLPREAFLSRTAHCLAELYCSALRLPAVEPDTTGVDEVPFAKEQSAALMNSLKEKFGPLDAYWRVFDSTERDSPVLCGLSLDISEIYFDLKEDLHLEETGISQSDLLWDWRFSFRSHWGRHLLGALAAIYNLDIE